MPVRLALLFYLYFVQGLPFGFQALALPVYLREANLSLTAITLASALSLPWMLKALWAPLVDRYASPASNGKSSRLGRRRRWILPMQLGLAAVCALAALTEPDHALAPLLVLVLAMNLFSATMDIAVDGLAIDILQPQYLGYGNIAQVVGYKIGMLTSGGLLLSQSARIGWHGMFVIMSILVLLGSIAVLAYREPAAAKTHEPPSSIRQVFALVLQALRAPGTGWLLVFIATYKLGESIAGALFRPFLVDSGFTKEQIGLWVSTYGMVASIAGSLAGGFLASRIRLLSAVGITAVMRALSVAGLLWLTLSAPTKPAIVAVNAAEDFFGGALTTAMFAYMMSRVDRRIGATHYTALATIEVLGKTPAQALAGPLADLTSYQTAYGVATVASFLFLALLMPIAKPRHD